MWRPTLTIAVTAVLIWSLFAFATRDGSAASPDSSASDSSAAAYLANNKCRICHSKQFKSWQTTPHAAAFTNLVQADSVAIKAMAKKLGVKLKGHAYESDDCIKCHVVGLHKPGGYPQPADSVANANLASVGCESCHGPGSRHMTAAEGQHKSTIQRGNEAMCRTCHTAQTSPKFDYATYRKTGIHVLPPP